MESKTELKLPEVGTCAVGTVVRVYQSYAILLFDDGWTGLLHISELSNAFIRNFTSFVTIGSIYAVKVISVNEQLGRVHVSLKQMNSGDRRRVFSHRVIEPKEINFDSLRERLPRWIEEQNKEITTL